MSASPTIPEYDDLDAMGLAALVRDGDVTPAELLEASAERIAARNPALNAVVYDMTERARQRLDVLPEGPLRGVPFLVKDLKLQIAGTPTTNSTRLMVNAVAARTSVLAQRYEDAGLQIVGKGHSSEMGIMGVTETALRGACRNPWNLNHTPGGSSGGSASAVAARITPAAHGGDGGGSIRIPASCTGLFGLKPTRGRVTMAPFMGEAWGGFVQEHVLCHSVRDSALFLDIEDPATPGEPYAAPAKARPWIEEVGVDPGKLRIAFTRETLYAGTTHPDCIAALDDAIALLTDLGHTLVEDRPEFPRADMVQAYFRSVAAGAGYMTIQAGKSAGRAPKASDFEPATWMMALIGRATSATELLEAQVVMQRANRDVAAFFQTYDLFITPTLAVPPPRIGEVPPTRSERAQLALLRRLPFKAVMDAVLGKLGEGKLAYMPNTQLFNQTGQPAMSVPLYWNEAGLPVGTQIVAPFGDEATLFRIGAQLEQARPWMHRKPPMLTAP